MKIEIGMFVRTKDGIVAKCDEIIKEFDISFDRDVFKAFDNHNPDCMEIPWKYINEYIKKYSFNIIDVIEIGDYVNGHKVIDIIEADVYGDEELTDRQIITEYTSYSAQNKTILNNADINQVVTKEQFESMKYVVERDK